MTPPPADSADLRQPLSSFDHNAMACTWGIQILGDVPGYAADAARAAFAEVDRLEQELSRFVPHSDIARINSAAPGQWTRIGPDACECLMLAIDMHKQAQGAFDVTVGAAVPIRAAGKSAIRNPQSTINPQSAIPNPQLPIGMHLLQLDRSKHSVLRKDAGLIIDLGAIGKGYAVDRAADVLREWGIAAALVHSGQSTVLAIEAPPGQTGWELALRNPLDHAQVIGTLRLRNQTLSGSGTLLHGQHIIDPRTGQPAGRRRAAWAVAASAAVSDAASTAFMVMTQEQIEAFCRANSDVAALLYTDEGELLTKGMTLKLAPPHS